MPESSFRRELQDVLRWAWEVGWEPGDSHSRPRITSEGLGGGGQAKALPCPALCGNERIQVMTLANRWDAGTPRDQRADPCLATASPACPAVPLKS